MRALTHINDVGGRFVLSANKFWWVYKIAATFRISPQDVKEWPASEVMEALAAIGLMEKKK